MFIGSLAIFAAIVLSAVSAYFSITGIVTVFSSQPIGVTFMAASLEFAKIIATIWLYSWWRKTNKLLKGYLTFAVTVLILISSLGIFSYLTKAFVGQSAPTDRIENQIERIDLSIQREERDIARAQEALDLLDQSIDQYLELNVISRGLEVREQQREERERLRADIDTAQDRIDELRDERLELRNQADEFSVNAGPVEYIAVLLYGEDNAESNLDNAVRIFIIMLVLVFDPFAVLLMVSGNISIDRWRTQRNSKKRYRKRKERKSAKKEKSVSPKTPKGRTERKDDDANGTKSVETRQKPSTTSQPTDGREETETVPEKNKKKGVVEVDMSQFVDPSEIMSIRGEQKRPLGRLKKDKNG